MKKGITFFTICFIITMSLALISTNGLAQIFGFGSIWQLPAFSSQPLQVPTTSFTTGDILVDNFEYWDSPYNHGWLQQEPAYPVYGFGIGYATIFNTVLDLQEGSRVLDVYRPPSVFLLSTPYERHQIFHSLFTPPSVDDPDGEACIRIMPTDEDTTAHSIISFDFRAPLGIEPWDIFELAVIGESDPNLADNDITVRIVPLQPPAGACLGPVNSAANMYGITAAVTGFNPAGQLQVTVAIGRGMLDGSWHAVWVDLVEAIKAAVDVFDDIDPNDRSDWYMARACAVAVSGQMFRLDNLLFRAEDYTRLDQPDFFEIGPLYAQLFEPYRYLLVADYHADTDIPHLGARQIISDFLLDMNNFTLDPNEIRDAWVSDLLALDPNYHVIDPNHALYDPNYAERWVPGDPNYGTPDPVAEAFIREGFTIDSTLPVFSDANIRIAGNMVEELQGQGILGWNVTVNGYGANAIQAFLVNPLPINPYDGMPTYIPAYYSSIAAIKATGKQHYGPVLSWMLEAALWNSGMTLWPNIAAMDYTPQYFEDLIITIEVTDGRRSDVRTIPISVVNYPVENYPPVAQIYASPKIFYVGQQNEYLIKFIDPDCFIFSLSPAPATTHVPGFPLNDWSVIRNDMDTITYDMTLNGASTYQYGPWINSIIDPCSGLISFAPKFEGLYTALITATDARGGVGFEDFPLLVVKQGTWLNHPPFITGCPTRPVVVKAGEEVMIGSPDFIVTDPDGDQMYASCNIGSCGRTADGAFTWKFQSNFPGTYTVEVVFYDIRGGYAIMKFLLDVKPWWSY